MQQDNIEREHQVDNPADAHTETPLQPAPPRGPSPILVIFFITGMMGVLGAAVMLLAEGQANSANQPPPTQPLLMRNNYEAPDFELTSLTGDTVSLSDFEGRAVFVNMWATWCVPCVAELPAFKQFVSEQGEDGAVLLAVNQGETPEQIEEFLESIDIDGVNDFTVLLDENLEFGDLYPYGGLPTTFIIGPEGTVRYTKLGAMEIEDMNLYLEEVMAEASAG